MLCALVARPAYAEPVGVPDSGARPVPAGPVTYPGEGTASGNGIVPTPAGGPLANQLMTEDIAVKSLEQRSLKAKLEVDEATERADVAAAALLDATDRVTQLREKAESEAAEAYKRATGLGPLDSYAHDLHQFSVLVPGLGQQPGGESAARDLLRAEQDERSAQQLYQLATEAVETARGKFDSINGEYTQRSAALKQLEAQNQAELLRIRTQQDAYEQSLGGANLADNLSIDGKQAHPNALLAVSYALGKRGSPYVWGDEGPSTFDCSGLAYWSYRQVGVTLPRVANDMYHGTPAIQATRSGRGDLLLPGDLVFFASDSNDWRSIYHMGIYIGGGRMVHAPRSGDVVRIAPVTWSRFFGATRIFGAVPAVATQPANPQPTNTGSAGATASPTASPTATATATAYPTVTISPPSVPLPSPIEPSPTTATTSETPTVTESSAATTTSTSAPPEESAAAVSASPDPSG